MAIVAGFFDNGCSVHPSFTNYARFTMNAVVTIVLLGAVWFALGPVRLLLAALPDKNEDFIYL